jgi:hypothetical protein
MTAQEMKNLRFLETKTIDGSWNETVKFKVDKEDFPFAIPALNWCCRDEVFWLPANAATNEIEAKGQFSITINKDDISSLVKDYLLLKEHFVKFLDVYITNRYIHSTLYFLLNAEENKKAPKWILRTAIILNEGE